MKENFKNPDKKLRLLYISELFLLALAEILIIFLLAGCNKENKEGLNVPAVITFQQVDSLTSTSAKFSGRVTSDGGAEVTSRGLCWDTSPSPTISEIFIKCGKDTGVFTGTLDGLTPDTEYHVRAFAKNSEGVAYGEEVIFTTKVFSLPILSTIAVNNISETMAESGGNIKSDGSAFITSRGVCWNTSPLPTIDNNKTADGNNKGQFTSTLTGLTASTKYYVRAYAKNAAGTAYGNEVSFTTPATALAKVSTSNVSNIISGSATCGGSIEPGSSVTERGVCWSTNHFPARTDYKASAGTGTGTFTCIMKSLASNTIYYVRAYVVNAAGVSYGNEVSFTSAISGNVTYTLIKETNPTPEQVNAYRLIKTAMDSAMYYYNTYTTITKHINVYYEPSVPTADGNSNGTIRFGSNTYYMNVGTAMHETAHTVGVGTTSAWGTLLVGGNYLGTNANIVLRTIQGDPAAIIHGDTQHFWPFGINYPNEVTSASVLINHCRIVEAMKKDGL